MSQNYLANLIEKIRANSDEVKSQFGKLSADQLNWKSVADQWSIGQCLDHIITLNRTYFPTFDKILQDEYRESLWQRIPLIHSIFGAMIIKAVQPESEKKYKTFPVFEPTYSMVDKNIIQNFQYHQSELVNLFNQFDQIEHQDIVISSPASKWITYRLPDCLKLLVIHEKRHLKQAKEMMESDRFPVQ